MSSYGAKGLKLPACLSEGWRIWLRLYSTNRKVAGCIPDGVINIILPATQWPWDRLSLEQK